ncbi:MAG: Smr/MutS family protein, partial [Myxococcota bacterium]
LVLERIPELRAATASLDHADLRQASARLGVDLEADVLPLAEGAEVALRTARHPLLLLDGVEVVASDLELRAGEGLVISGPNAGGKTVALKLLGLAALMQRAGLPVPAAEGSRCGFFRPVLTDVGDEQSIQKNLSTFSAHVTNLAAILERSDQGAMVLLDELAGGTDPEEGAALAQALVDAFCRRGVALATTTHYEPLKAFAARDPRLRNASVGFDVEAMMPTFALHWDVPGASSALSVAGRFGIPQRILQTAREMLPEHTRTFDELVRGLEAQRQELALAQAGVESERAAAKAAREEIEERLEAMRERGRKAVDDEAKRLRDQLRDARNELRKLRKTLRKQADEEALAAAKQRIDAAAALAEKHAPALGPVVEAGESLASVAAGDRVFVPRLRTEAEVLEAPGRGQVRVAAGALKLWINREELRAVSERSLTPAEKAAMRAKRAPAAPTPTVKEAPRDRPQHPDNTLDVRGLRVDDALAMTETFLDRLFGASEGTGYIVHGMGSGALRQAIRAHLDADGRYVRGYRGGSSEEGGERLTVVTLR